MKAHPDKKVMTSIGFKSPHTPMRVPARFYMPYLEPERAAATPWSRATPSELSFPSAGGFMGYHCCAENNFVYLKENGTVQSTHKIEMSKKAVTDPIPLQAHVELVCCGVASLLVFFCCCSLYHCSYMQWRSILAS